MHDIPESATLFIKLKTSAQHKPPQNVWECCDCHTLHYAREGRSGCGNLQFMRKGEGEGCDKRYCEHERCKECAWLKYNEVQGRYVSAGEST